MQCRNQRFRLSRDDESSSEADLLLTTCLLPLLHAYRQCAFCRCYALSRERSYFVITHVRVVAKLYCVSYIGVGDSHKRESSFVRPTCVYPVRKGEETLTEKKTNTSLVASSRIHSDEAKHSTCIRNKARSMTTLSSKLRPLMQRAVKSHATRSMTVLSKESGDEYKKLVRYVKSLLEIHVLAVILYLTRALARPLCRTIPIA